MLKISIYSEQNILFLKDYVLRIVNHNLFSLGLVILLIIIRLQTGVKPNPQRGFGWAPKAHFWPRAHRAGPEPILLVIRASLSPAPGAISLFSAEINFITNTAYSAFSQNLKIDFINFNI